jgi:hypothetical protein
MREIFGHHLDPADTDPAAASYVQAVLLADMVDIALYKCPIVPISSQLQAELSLNSRMHCIMQSISIFRSQAAGRGQIFWKW